MSLQSEYDKNVDQWRVDAAKLWNAVDRELVSLEMTIDSFDTPEEALDYLIQANIDLALDKRVNGGFELKPVETPIMQSWVEYQQNTVGRSARIKRFW